jgi:hypothetical protein
VKAAKPAKCHPDRPRVGATTCAECHAVETAKRDRQRAAFAAREAEELAGMRARLAAAEEERWAAAAARDRADRQRGARRRMSDRHERRRIRAAAAIDRQTIASRAP